MHMSPLMRISAKVVITLHRINILYKKTKNINISLSHRGIDAAGADVGGLLLLLLLLLLVGVMVALREV